MTFLLVVCLRKYDKNQDFDFNGENYLDRHKKNQVFLLKNNPLNFSEDKVFVE